jgi:hypothetical protein
MIQLTSYEEVIQPIHEVWDCWLSVADYLLHRWLDTGDPDIREAYIVWVHYCTHMR